MDDMLVFCLVTYMLVTYAVLSVALFSWLQDLKWSVLYIAFPLVMSGPYSMTTPKFFRIIIIIIVYI